MIETVVLAAALMAGPGISTTTLEQAQTSASAIPAKWRTWAECVSQRESGGRYDARNRSGSTAQGRWQFLDRAWRVQGGIEWIVLRQLKAQGVTWRDRKRAYGRLSATPIYRWPAWAQDAAFVGVITERSTGWRHWSLPGHRCQRLLPAGAQ